MLNEITELLEKEPFIPFRIVVTSGHEYDIVNPRLVATGKTQITVYKPQSDHFAILRLNQLATLETIDPPPHKTGKRK